MGKKEEFKIFASKHPDLVTLVRDKKHSWQDLYEVFDLYGEDETAWSKYLDNNNINSVNATGELTKLFKNINIENVQKYIETAQKAISIVGELTGAGAVKNTSSGPASPRPINKIFED